MATFLCIIIKKCFFIVGPPKEDIFLTAFYGLYFNPWAHIFYRLHFIMARFTSHHSTYENDGNRQKGASSLCSGFYYSPLMGALAIFSTGTYGGIGKMCVKSETCYEKYHKKTFIYYFVKVLQGWM